MDKLKTIVVNIVAIALLALILLWGNTWYRQWRQFERGEKALQAGDTIGAIAGFESAIHMYTPLSPLVERAATRLWGIGEQMERQGDVPRALVAYRSLRSSFYAVHGLNRPGTEWIARCDARIAALTQTRTPN